MPQKKNPDMAELSRGKTGRVYGDLMALLRDEGSAAGLQQGHAGGQGSRLRRGGHLEAVPDTFRPMLATMTPLPENMRARRAKGFINATDCADYLVTKKGMPFRDAYKLTGDCLVAACIKE